MHVVHDCWFPSLEKSACNVILQENTAMTDTAIYQSARMLALKQRAQIRNRQQTVLGRAAHSVGIPDNEPLFFNHVQGKIRPSHAASFERHGGCMS